jgi:hypothetical protein
MYIMFRQTEKWIPLVTAPLMSVLLHYNGNAINKPLFHLARLLTITHVWGSHRHTVSINIMETEKFHQLYVSGLYISRHERADSRPPEANTYIN